MSRGPTINFSCSDDFPKLAALSIAGALTPDQWARLAEHVRVCAQCASLLADYRSLASEGMAKLGAVRSPTTDEFDLGFLWDREEARARLFSTLDASTTGHPAWWQPEFIKTALASIRLSGLFGLSRLSTLVSIAAVLLVATAVAYQAGLRRGVDRSAQGNSLSFDGQTLRQQLTDLQAQRAALKEKLVADTKTIAAAEERASSSEKELAHVQALKVSLEAKARELASQNEQQSSSLLALSTERDSLEQKLRNTDSLIQPLRQDLSASVVERQKMLQQSGMLETQISRLSTQLRELEEESQRQAQYLVSDRDIRELMGARQLYIADVFDIDSRGKTKKPFGRVFYTRGKSLIFYAFDLDQQPGYREAKAFQAWGRPGSSEATPVSLGILYMDNESNRRWKLEFNNPRVLEEINAVFVTVEPKGGSQKPTNKPFLLAYLHTSPPNHP